MVSVDIVLGLSYGDEGKAKVVHDLISKNDYTHCMRFNGGANAGHTVYVEGVKVVTHSIPTGALQGIESIIGSGCVLNVNTFFSEMKLLSEINPNIHDVVKIASNCHIVTDEHLKEELLETKIGTTKQGIGPAYRDKYSRVGIRAEDIPELKNYIVDSFDVIYNQPGHIKVLAEGAQAMFLDVDLGDYPYCTSSHCGVGGVINNGISHKDIDQVIGVAKCYETYVGAKSFQGDESELDKIGDKGCEYGATTGRRRQVNYFDTNRIVKACTLTGTSKLIVNKLDVLRDLGIWKAFDNKGNLVDFKTENNFTSYVKSIIPEVDVIFSSSPYKI